MIPMLEFSKIPPRNEDRLKKRRRRVLKTPKFPKVRSVAISSEARRSPSSRDDHESLFPGSKWVGRLV